jgi:subtilisin family serine protease
VISVGGVFIERDGRLRASDYASGFESKVYPGRKVPDVSGAVGMLPRATYLMLPVQPGCHIDSHLGGSGYPAHDRTGPRDGWAAFSGTSAAAPQVAGVCALVRQANPALPPAAVRDLLGRTARNVGRGSNHPRMGPQVAGQGYDLATGHGLVDAWSAVRQAGA